MIRLTSHAALVPRLRQRSFQLLRLCGSALVSPRVGAQWYTGRTAEYMAVLRLHARTFSFASAFLPPAVQVDVAVLYAFFRTLDDLVDETCCSQRHQIRRELLAWNDWFACGQQGAAPREPLGSDLAAVIEAHRLDRRLFVDFLEGLFTDLDGQSIPDSAALIRYCYCVASTVGLALVPLLGTKSRLAIDAARALGIAMQLTNIIRDVGEDLQRGRLYLPLSDLDRFGSSPEHLRRLLEAGRGPDERFRALMRFQIIRAESYYERALDGVGLLPFETQIGIRTAAQAYRRILREVERNEYDTLRYRASTTFDQKVIDLGRAVWTAILQAEGVGGEGGR